MSAFVKLSAFLASTEEGQSSPRSHTAFYGLFESGPLRYLWDWVVEIGINSTAITWTEIMSWSQMCGIKPNPSECSAITLLSRNYVNELNRGRIKGAMPLDECLEYIDG